MAHFSLSLCFLSFLLLISNSPTLALKCNNGDLKTLLKIKQSLGNPSILSSWVPTTDCCTWANLKCDTSGHVNSLSIKNADLFATIPPFVSDLTALIALSFVDLPGLTGPIPLSLFKHTNLQALTIIRTSVTGLSSRIPDSFCKLSQLDTLDLSFNKLTGTIPSSLAKLPKLRFLDLSHNGLTGSVLPGLVHGKFAYLVLSHNLLTGRIPEEYGSEDLHMIDLSHNQLTGDASYLFGSQKSTTEIYLSWNRLEFDISNAVFPNGLTDLDLSHNMISGKVPSSIRDLTMVRKLDLSYNKLCGEIPNGGVSANLGFVAFGHNKCLCGAPLSPCKP
ncbi:hypothetical protein LUZ60_003378 [Juncus effusus]|nr:hypothetical protein LUZ60_003378 [Juncus effusus]